MSDKVVHIDSRKPHVVAELICINCKKRWIGVFPDDIWLSDIVCPKCNEVGGVIMTGQPIDEEGY